MVQGIVGLESSRVVEKNQAYDFLHSPICNCAHINLSSKCNKAIKLNRLPIHYKKRAWIEMPMQVQERNDVILTCNI